MCVWCVCVFLWVSHLFSACLCVCVCWSLQECVSSLVSLLLVTRHHRLHQVISWTLTLVHAVLTHLPGRRHTQWNMVVWVCVCMTVCVCACALIPCFFCWNNVGRCLFVSVNICLWECMRLCVCMRVCVCVSQGISAYKRVCVWVWFKCECVFELNR